MEIGIVKEVKEVQRWEYWEKILAKEKTETKKGNQKKANDDANREKMRKPAPVKTSVFDKVRSQKEQSAKKAPKVKAERASQKAAQKKGQKNSTENSKA